MSHVYVRKTRLGLLVALCFAGTVQLSAAQTITPEPARRSELLHLLRNDCGACHGLHLTGGLGPALRPEALNEKPHEFLVQVILKGRPGTAMPGWERFMNEDEASWLADTLLRGLSDEN